AHNGEINTLWGNRNAMGARETVPASPEWREGVDRLKPVIWAEGSDSASLDNALELLVRSGRDPVHALMMLLPESHEGAVELSAALRGFYEFHECLVEPWDGPAALAFPDGVPAGAAGHYARRRAARRGGAHAAPARVRLRVRRSALRARADGERWAGCGLEHGGRHPDSPAFAPAAERVRLHAPALRPSDEPADRSAARGTGDVAAHAPRPARLPA